MRAPADRQPVDVAVLAADASTDDVAIDHDRAVTFDAPEPVVVRGDRDHLRQAVSNLVTNGVQHTPAGTPLEVSATTESGARIVVIRDHGAGLSPEALAHAFDRFWRGDSAPVGTGSGLALAIVAAIAEEHGGTITATNSPSGRATFTLRLPISGG